MAGGKKRVDWGAREGVNVDAASPLVAATGVSGGAGAVGSQHQRDDATGPPLSELDRSRFDTLFHALTGNQRFPWQCSLYERLVEATFPERCDIPTGLGKTSIIAIWLLALAHRARNGVASGFPRRLVYVVNRRTVVDQATREAELLRDPHKLKDAQLQDLWRDLHSLGIQDARGLRHLEAPFAISTLRGQFADNAEWRTDPARPAIIVGTVDMIGSRLLFSGYGRGFKARPLHAGFLAQDTLLVHDEAHLEPAFQELVTAIESEQRKAEGTLRDGFRRLRVMALTATSRGAEDRPEGMTLRLGDADRKNAVVRERIGAKKGIAFHPQEEKSVAEQIANLALAHKDRGQAILVFVRRVEDVATVIKKLPADSYATLTGTMRGRERDQLKKTNPIFARFDPKSEVPETDVRKGTVYLVCTSAGEVGVDMSADHLVCDLTPFDSMAQRFGRVNRFGGGDARIDIVHATDESPPKRDSKKKSKAKNDFDVACERTRALLQSLPLQKLPREDARHDASPVALSEISAKERQEAFTPAPVILPVTDILFDAWALTSIREKFPGRPPVADWLHGVPQEWDPPETYVAWRDEVELLSEELLEKYRPQDLLEDYPLKPHELLRDRTDRVFKQIEAIAKRCEDRLAWLIDSDGRVRWLPLSDLVAKDGQNKPRINLAYCTVLLPPRVGGLEASGLLRGEADFEDGLRYDVADEWLDEKDRSRRCRLDGDAADDDEEKLARRKGMRLVCTIHLREDAESEDDETDGDSDANARRVWRWYVRPQFADDDGSRTATKPQTLPFHLESAEHFAREIVTRLGLKEPETSAVVWAARFHDLGKTRALWQRSIGNRDPDKVLAKSGGKGSRETTGYRHEFGSLFDLEQQPEFLKLPDEAQELARHIIATHHGRARPHFSTEEAFDPNHSDKASAAIAREVPRRFARLQRKYGRWGLAYLESLVRAADALASQVLESDAHNTPSGQMAAE